MNTKLPENKAIAFLKLARQARTTAKHYHEGEKAALLTESVKHLKAAKDQVDFVLASNQLELKALSELTRNLFEKDTL